MGPTYSAKTVTNFESTAAGLSNQSTLTCFQDGTFGPYDQTGTVTNGFNARAEA